MRNLLTLIFRILPLYLLFLNVIATPVYAESLGLSPNPVNYGGNTTLNVTGINTQERRYNVEIKLSINSCTSGGSIGGALFTTHADGTCSTDKRGSDFWVGNLNCNPGSNLFSGIIDTSKLGLGNLEGSDVNLRACVLYNDGEDRTLDKLFTIKATGSTSFGIDFIFNFNGDQNSASNLAKPGEEIGVRLERSQPGSYGLRIGDGAITNQNCTTTSCTLYGRIPNDSNVPPTLSVTVVNSSGDTQSSIVYIQSNTSDTVPTPTLSPTPSPTPLPPHPPCSVPYFNDEDEFVGCAAVSTGLGVPISTDPAYFIRSIFRILLSISGGIAILLIMRAGYKFMTSQGDPERVKEAREILTSAVIGLLFLIFSLVILEVIGVDLLGIPGINR